MALLLSAFSALNGSFTAQDTGEGYCSSFYGGWPNSNDCTKAIRGLEHGAAPVDYTVNQHAGDKHELPLQVAYGDCMIQVEIAGPRPPKTFEFIPDEIVMMAQRLQSTCVQGKSYYGGFLTSDMQVLKSWVTSAESYLDKPFPTSTAFLTVSISNLVPDWLSPGNYDPVIPEVLAQVEFDAIKGLIPGTRLVAELLARAHRLLKQSAAMEPRGHRIPWWYNPGNGANNSAPHPVHFVSLAVNSTDSASTSSKRRRTVKIGPKSAAVSYL